MFVTISLEEFHPIIELLKEDNEGDVEAWIDMGRLFVRGDENEVMLRFNQVTKKITIARIQFAHTRKGYGTKLISMLKSYGTTNGYHFIELESLLTDEVLFFAKKHGFQPKDTVLQAEGYMGDWILSIS